jgi:hypothetical protein
MIFMEQVDDKIFFNDNERTLTGLPESIRVHEALQALDLLHTQEVERRQQLQYLRSQAESSKRGMIPIAENNLLELGRLTGQLIGIAAPQVVERFLEKSQ